MCIRDSCRDDPNVNNAAALGIVTGYEDGTFRPYKTISRQAVSYTHLDVYKRQPYSS